MGRRMGAKFVQRLPHRLEGAAPILIAEHHGFLIYRFVREVSLVDQYDLVPGLAVISEDILYSAQVPQVGGLDFDLLVQFARKGLLSALPKRYGPPEGTIESLPLGRVVALCHEDAVIFSEDADSYCSDAGRFHISITASGACMLLSSARSRST